MQQEIVDCKEKEEAKKKEEVEKIMKEKEAKKL